MITNAKNATNTFHPNAPYFVTWLLTVIQNVPLVTKSSTKLTVQEIVHKSFCQKHPRISELVMRGRCVETIKFCEQWKVPAPGLLYEKKNDTTVTMTDLLQSHFDNCYHDRAARYAMCGLCGTGFSGYLPYPKSQAKTFIDPETKKPDPSLAEWEMVRHVVECKGQEVNNRQCQACRKNVAVNKSLRGMASILISVKSLEIS